MRERDGCIGGSELPVDGQLRRVARRHSGGDLGGERAPVGDPAASPELGLTLDDAERIVIDQFTREPRYIDEISAAFGLPIHQLATQLMMLELQGAVPNTGAQHYALL